MPRPRFVLAITLACATLLASPAAAVSYTPFLQLEIKQGVYDNTIATTVATTNAFTLHAYLTPQPLADGAGLTLEALLRDDYFTAALTPRMGPTDVRLGSFTFNGVTINATADMVYGTVPADAISDTSGAIPRPDVYETFFKEFEPFRFQSDGRAVRCGVNVNCAVGSGVPMSLADESTPSSRMYYMAFTVDTAALSPNTQVHFDLYSMETGTVSGDQDRDIKYMAAAAYDRHLRNLRRQKSP